MTRPIPLTAVLLFPLVTGCGLKVTRWEGSNLAKPEMALDPYPNDTAFRQHTFFS